MSVSRIRLPAVLALTAAVLAACGDSGSDPVVVSKPSAPSGTTVSGVAVKGPLVNATVKAYAVDYSAADLIGAAAPVDTGTTNGQAQITGIALDPAGAPYVIVVEANAGTTDLTTGLAPVITRMKTIITADMLNNSTPVVATPLTSMAVEVAASKTPSPATLQQSLKDAQNTVKTTLGFGLGESVDLFTASPVLTDDADTEEERKQVAAYRLAVEAVSAVLNTVATQTGNATGATGVLSDMAQDLADGSIDTTLSGVNGVDLEVANLKIPGTNISVTDIATVLNNETATLGSSQTVDPSEVPAPEPVATVADTDYDGVPDDSDNCVNVKNGADEDNQLDANNNEVGAACEAAPGISAVAASGEEDGGDIVVQLAHSDAQGDTPTFTVDGVALAPGESSYTYTPAPDFHGEVVLSYSVSDGESSSVDSTITITVTPTDDLPAGTLSIVGDANEGATLSLDNQLSDVDGQLNVVSYQWYADDVAITSGTQSTFTLRQADVGKEIRAEVVVSDGVFANATVPSDTIGPVVNYVNNPGSGSVVINGTSIEGQLLEAVQTLSDPDGPISGLVFQWLAGGVPIDGANSDTLLLGQAQVGKAVSVRVDYFDGTFSNNVTSDPTNPVQNINSEPGGSVTITGTPTEDETLQADTSAIVDEDGLVNAVYSYQWFADDVAIEGATSSQLTLGDAEVDKAIKVRVEFTDDLNGEESLFSEPTELVENVNDPVQGSVTISGSAMVTEQLSVANFLATLTDADGLPATPPAETTYQWKRDGVDIAAANAATYLLEPADQGAVITVEIQFPDSRGTTETVLSQGTAPVAQVNNQPTGSVVISGDTQNQTWTVTNTLEDADGPETLDISYQWYADGSPIAGATSDNFTPDQTYVGASIFVRASYTDDGGNYTERDSAPVVVLDADDAYTGGVSISGTAEEDQTLTATNDLADVDGAIVIESYQWKADGVNINGATSDTLLLGQEQVGAVITVDVTFNDGVFGSQTATSAGTSAVANVNDAPQGSVTFSGAAAPGNDLTASNTLSDEDGIGMVNYEWFVDGVTTSVLSATYSVQPEDVGLEVFVRASYVDGQGTSESVDSASVTVQDTVQAFTFNPANFSGQTVYPVFVEDGDDSECYGTSTFARVDMGPGGDFTATMACDDSSFTGTWAFEQGNEVLVLDSAAFAQSNYVVAYADVADNKQAYCWVDDGDVTDSATALDICRLGPSSTNYHLIENDFDSLGFDSFYFNQADVHADTFDAKRFSHTWLAGRTLFDVWYGRVDYNGDCNIDTENDRGLTQLVFSSDGLTVDISGVANDACIENDVDVTINEHGQLGGADDGAGINYLGSTDLYLEVVFRNEDGSPDNIDYFFHTQSDAQAAYDALPGAGVPTATYDQAFRESQLLKSPIYNVYQTGGQWYVEKIEFFGAGSAQLTERTAEGLRFSDDAASYIPEPTSYSVSVDHISLTNIDQGEIYWHISEDPNVGAGYMTPQGNGFEVCWWDGVGSPCDNSIEQVFFSEEAAQRYIDGLNEVDNELVGSWLIDEGPGARNVLTFIDNSRYVVFHEHSNEDQTAGSAEYGNYTWDGLNMTTTVIDESDAEGGLGDSSLTAEVFGDDLYLDGSPIGTRIADAGNPIVGSWLGGSGDDITVLTMLSTSEYAIVHTQNGECYSEPCTPQALSGEFGFYTWDGYNFTATSVSVDTNGPGGLYNADDPSDQMNESIQISGAQLTFTDDNEGAFFLDRVGAPTINLVCGYESGWDDMLEQPLIFNSIDDYNTVVADCDMQNGPLPSFSKADLAGLTLYDGSGEVTFDATADTAVFTDYGDDEIKGTGDDELYDVVVTDFDTNQVMLDYTTVVGEPVDGYDLLTLLAYDGVNEYQFAVFFEEYAWAQSDGNALDTTNKDGEIWYWTMTETPPASQFVCGYEAPWDEVNDRPAEFISIDDYNAIVADCELQNGPRQSLSTATLANKTLYENEGEISFGSDGTTATIHGYGDNGINESGSGDDETFYATVSNFGTDQVKLEYSLTQGGAIIDYELLTLLSYDGTTYEFAVFFEDFGWPNSDSGTGDTSNKDGEIWYWTLTE